MLCVISFFSGDKPQAMRLSEWIRELGGVTEHDCLLVVDKETNSTGVEEPLQEVFRSVSRCVSSESLPGTWGNGTTDASAPNEMWLTAAWNIYHVQKCRWLWVEPDAIPTRATWVDEIEADDKAGAKPFTGARVDMPPHELHMSGIAVYPPNVCDYSLAMMQPGRTAWDYAGREDTIKKAHFTDLIQHVYRINGESPTFPDAAALSGVLPRTAIYHRCKDGTLIDRLRENVKVPVEVANDALHAMHNIPAKMATRQNPPGGWSEANAIDFLAGLAKRSGIDKGRITKRLRRAGVIK